MPLAKQGEPEKVSSTTPSHSGGRTSFAIVSLHRKVHKPTALAHIFAIISGNDLIPFAV